MSRRLVKIVGRYIDDGLYQLLPMHLRRGMELYIEEGLAPGGFLLACLKNDLWNAVKRCDDPSLGTLRRVVEWLLMYAPANCWGSEDKVGEWLARAAEEQLTQ